MAVTGVVAAGIDKLLIPMIEFDMDFYLKKVLTDYEKDWIGSVLSGSINGIYYRIKDELDKDSIKN